MSDSLGDRMKRYEYGTRQSLYPRLYAVIRVDGRAFHSYLRGADKPYDRAFIADMGAVAVALCEEIQGAVFAYQQSDEISVLIEPGQENTQPWFGGEIQKIVSISAAIASVILASRRLGTPVFDSRVFSLPSDVEVANYFLWRQRDAVRNSVSMAAQAKFSARELHGVNSGQMQEMLWSRHGINWNDYRPECKRGQVAVRCSGEREVSFVHKRTGEMQTATAVRSWWEVAPAPQFSASEGFLPDVIPPLSRLT